MSPRCTAGPRLKGPLGSTKGGAFEAASAHQRQEALDDTSQGQQTGWRTSLRPRTVCHDWREANRHAELLFRCHVHVWPWWQPFCGICAIDRWERNTTSLLRVRRRRVEPRPCLHGAHVSCYLEVWWSLRGQFGRIVKRDVFVTAADQKRRF